MTKEQHAAWFRSFWTDVPGASTRSHPAPFPVELATRLVRMFSFTGDTVLDPFAGTASTLLAATACGRNAIGVEVDPQYVRQAEKRIAKAQDRLPLYGLRIDHAAYKASNIHDLFSHASEVPYPLNPPPKRANH